MKSFRRLMALIMCLAICTLCACQAAPAPAAAPEAEKPAQPDLPAEDITDGVLVSSVDEFLAAIKDDTKIVFAPGTYDLDTASDYGQEQGDKSYGWREVYDGSELVISSVKGLSLVANGEVTISAGPRYAAVLNFINCDELSLSGLTLGHREEPGACSGGVLYLDGCKNASVRKCGLYGCGILGVQAVNCETLRVNDSKIYDCSQGGVDINACRDVLFDGCEFFDCEGYALFSVSSGTNCAVINSSVHDNKSSTLISARGVRAMYMGGVDVKNNVFYDAMFTSFPGLITVEGCSLLENTCTYWYASENGSHDMLLCADADGNKLDFKTLSEMTLSDNVTWSPADLSAAADTNSDVQAGEDGYIHVSTVDELLAAIAPNAKIYLEDGDYDLSAAADYGFRDEDGFYYWSENFDGFGLVISNVDGLEINGGGKDAATILALPRYADVLHFDNCTGIRLRGFTAGHTLGAGDCVGDVLHFEGCTDTEVSDCGIFGCGVIGISANNCDDLLVLDTEIYECSSSAADIYGCRNVSFEGCSIHDNGDDVIWVMYSENVTSDDGKIVSMG